MRWFSSLLLSTIFLAACAAPAAQNPAAPQVALATQTPILPTPTPENKLLPSVAALPDASGYQWQQLISGLARPVALTHAGDGSQRIFVANKNGTITIFQWSSNANFTDTLNAPLTDSTATIQPMQSGWYFARALDNICGGVDSVRINVSLGDPRLIGENGICSMDTAQLNLSGIDQGATIAWSPAEEILIGQGTPNASVAPVETSTYGVTVTTLAGCTWSGTITVGVSPIMGGTVTATVDQTIV